MIASSLWYVAETPESQAAEETRSALALVAAPAGEQHADSDEDSRVPVQVWTVLAAGGALSAGLVLYLVRVAAGWVKAPPPQDEGH